MTASRRYLAAGLTAGLVAVAGCQPKYICDQFPDDEMCRPLALSCSLDPADSYGRLDLAGEFSIGARDLRAQVLKEQAGLQSTVQLDYLDVTPVLSTGKLSAIVLESMTDDTLRLKLTDRAGLMPRRGGAANLKVTLGRWTGTLDDAQQKNGCSFVIGPRFSPVDSKFDAPRPDLRQAGAKLFVGKRTGCSVSPVSCQNSSALYVSFVGPDGGLPRLQLTRFVLDISNKLLTEDVALNNGFKTDVSPSFRPTSAAVVATASYLILDYGGPNLIKMSATSTTTQTPLPVPLHTGLQAAYETERLYLGSATGSVFAFELPDGMLVTGMQTMAPPYRFFGRAPQSWSIAATPDVLLFNDQREVEFLCFPLACGADGLIRSARDRLSSASFTAQAAELDPVLADLDADGLVDLVVLDNKSKKISWMSQLRDGTFALPQLLDKLPDAAGFAVADMDGDGLMDLAILAASSPTGSNDLSVYLNLALSPTP